MFAFTAREFLLKYVGIQTWPSGATNDIPVSAFSSLANLQPLFIILPRLIKGFCTVATKKSSWMRATLSSSWNSTCPNVCQKCWVSHLEHLLEWLLSDHSVLHNYSWIEVGGWHRHHYPGLSTVDLASGLPWRYPLLHCTNHTAHLLKVAVHLLHLKLCWYHGPCKPSMSTSLHRLGSPLRIVRGKLLEVWLRGTFSPVELLLKHCLAK